MVGGLRAHPADAGLEGPAVAVAWRPGSVWSAWDPSLLGSGCCG